MWSIKGLQRRYRLLIMCFTAMFVMAFVIVMLIPTYLYMMEQNNFKYIERSIQDILNQPTNKQETLFQELVDHNAIELVVINEQGQPLFRTLKVEQLIDAKNVLNQRAISFESASQVIGLEGTYDVWFAVYHLSPSQYLGVWTLAFLVVILLMFTVMSSSVTYTFKLLLKPVQRLKKNIAKIQNYDFDLVDEKEDVLNKELNLFIQDIQGQMEKAQEDYSVLEIELQRKNEELINRSELVASLTHDLKVPISLGMLQIEQVIHKVPMTEGSLERTYKRLEEAIFEVNDIVKIMYSKNSLVNEMETFDLVNLVDQVTATFQPFLKERRIGVEIQIDDHVYIESNRLLIKQVLYNAFSNVVRYGKEHGELVVSLSEDSNSVTLSIYNEADQLTDEQLHDIFKLFYRSNSKDSVGTGTGLYTIKRIVERMNGTCAFRNEGKGVILILRFEESNAFKRVEVNEEST